MDNSETNNSSKEIIEVQSESFDLGAPLVLEDSSENIFKDQTPVDQEVILKTQNTLNLFESEDIFQEDEKFKEVEEENEIINSSQPMNESRKRKLYNLDGSSPKITKTTESETSNNQSFSSELNDLKEKAKNNVASSFTKMESGTSSASISTHELNDSKEESKIEDVKTITELSTTKVDSATSSASTSTFEFRHLTDEQNVEEPKNNIETTKLNLEGLKSFQEISKNSIASPKESKSEINGKDIEVIIDSPSKKNKFINGEKINSVVNSETSSKFDKHEEQISHDNLELVKENSLNSSNHVSPFLNLKESSSTPNTENSKSPIGSNQVSRDTLSPTDLLLENKNLLSKKNAFYVEILYTIDEKDPCKKEIQQIICDDLTANISHKRLSDSSGALGDISKSVSPNSVTSLQEPYILPNRTLTASNITRLSNVSRMSSSSTSSTISSKLNENFLVPNIPFNRTKDKISNIDRKVTQEQLDAVKSNWTNAEKLFQILYEIDNNGNSVNVSTVENSPKANNFDSGISSFEISKINEENDVLLNTKVKNIKNENKAASSPKSSKRVGKSNQTSLAKNISKKLESTPKKDKSLNSQQENKIPTNSETPPSDSSIASDHSSIFTVGQSVFARWTDKYYYSGKILGYLNNQTWNVRFDDGGKKAVKEEFIIGNCHNLLKGISVYAITDKERKYDTGIVTQLWIENDVIQYEVIVDNGPAVVVSAPDIFLSEDQATCVKKLMTHTPPGSSKQLSEVTLDNIVDGKRSTRSSRKNLLSSRPQAEKIVPRKIITNETAIEAIPGVEPELQASTPVKKEKGPNKKKKLIPVLCNLDSENVIETLGPIPEKGSTLFKDLQFILVRVNNPTFHTKANNESSTEAETDTESMNFTKIPFDEDRLKNQIIAGGGTIYQHFEDIPVEEYSTCKLISNRPNKTAKYVQCLAAGMTLVCHEWIVNCCRHNKLSPFQELPTGWSVEKQTFIESYQRVFPKPFKNCFVMIAPHSDKQFIRFWDRVCTLAGGTVTEIDSEELQFQAATFILGDTDCSERIVDKARLWEIPILSTNWIVQSLIHGEVRGFDAHPSYSFDFVESD